MKQNMNIEAEGSELILKNEAGDYVIIPKNRRTEVQKFLEDDCHSCIDDVVETLPTMSDYAQDGSLLPSWKKVKAVLNPKNWGVPDYSDKELSELNVDKKDFDTLALQRELSNRGYKLPKSTKEDGTFDGTWGDETKNALLEYRKSQTEQ